MKDKTEKEFSRLEFADYLQNFIRAIEKQEFEVMHHEIQDLGYRMKACHKEFK